MEHTCQQCGTAVEDGRPFCPQCRAPQIHVQIATPDAETAAGLYLAADELSPEVRAEARVAAIPAGPASSSSSRTLDSRIALRSALKAGALGVFIGAIPFVGMALTGALAVVFYRRKTGSILPAALGARLGGAAGFVIFAIGALCAMVIVAFHGQQQSIDLMMTTFQRLGANTADPQIQASFHNVFTATGQAAAFCFSVVSAAVGGALVAWFLRPRNPRE